MRARLIPAWHRADAPAKARMRSAFVGGYHAMPPEEQMRASVEHLRAAKGAQDAATVDWPGNS